MFGVVLDGVGAARGQHEYADKVIHRHRTLFVVVVAVLSAFLFCYEGANAMNSMYVVRSPLEGEYCVLISLPKCTEYGWSTLAARMHCFEGIAYVLCVRY